VEVLNHAQGRPGTAENPPRHWFWELALGLCAAAGLALLRLKAQGPGIPGKTSQGAPRYVRIFGIAQAALGLFFGVMGVLLFFMTFFTDHDYTFHNINVIFINPLLLAAIPLGIITAFGRNPKKRRICEVLLQTLWTYVFLAGIVTVAIRLFPGFYQQNQPTQAMVLPLAFVLSFIPNVMIVPRAFRAVQQR
jgi:cytochrome bd-type quinol oxidase subunit 2